MSKRRSVGLVTVFAFIVALAGSSFAAEFSADLLLKQAKETMTGKVYVKGDKTRQEYLQGGTKQVMIFRFDKGITWILLPAEKVYMEMSSRGNSAGDPKLDQKIKDKAVAKYLGKEEVNGYVCDKYQYIYNDKSLGVITQWFSKKLSYLIKSEYNAPSGYTLTEYKNIKEGAVADNLFEVPGDYARMSVPGMR
jgi:outer membrane lipoprotein-sorting protein